jgi:prepilin-type N-terminal cleavage/methylation domain-containing protein
MKLAKETNTLNQKGFTQPVDNQQAGFTIIELLIATTVFSVILLLCAVALIQISRVYYKGITTTKTQEAARGIIDDISRNIQFSGGTVTGITTNGGVSTFCVNTVRYTFKANTQVTDNSPVPAQQQGYHALVKDTCGTAAPDLNASGLSGGAIELVPQKMRLAKLIVCEPGDAVSASCPAPPAAGSNLYNISIRVVSGDNDLLCSPAQGNCSSSVATDFTNTDIICKNFSAGMQFCAYSELTTSVQKRI